MSCVRILKANGDEHTVTLLTMTKWLADEASYLDVLGRLIDHGTTIVELKESAEGNRTQSATLFYLPTPTLPVQLPPRNLPLREFAADAQLLFVLPGHIRCRANSEPEARELITEVFHGSRTAPPGFEVEINGDDIEGFIANIDLALASDRPRGFGVQDITITSITERRLIGSAAS
jgi:hypothetical protein